MMIFDKFVDAWDRKDAEAELALFHDDWEFKFHSSGKVMKKGEYNSTQRSQSGLSEKRQHTPSSKKGRPLLKPHPKKQTPNSSHAYRTRTQQLATKTTANKAQVLQKIILKTHLSLILILN